MTFKINGTQTVYPASISITYSDIDGQTTRNARGEMMRDRIATKVKIALKWNALEDYDAKKILNAVKDVFFPVTYYDPIEGKVITKTFYCGDRTAPVYTQSDDFPSGIWNGIAFNLIEK